MKKVAYTMIFGDYDNLKKPSVITEDWDYVCFTNNKKLKSDIWQIRYVNDKKLGNKKFPRKIWILFHKYLNEYDLSLMLGGQIQIKDNLNKICKSLLPNDDTIDMAMARHPNRTCIYEEAKRCIKRKWDNPKVIKAQMDKYKKEGYPKNNGLVACGVIIRKHHRSNLEKHCDLWWNEVKKYSLRDQLSFNYIWWKYNLVKISFFDYNLIRGKMGTFFKKYKHKK